MSQPGAAQTRLRIQFAKRGNLRFTSHLDLARIWERLLRRAGVQVLYSQGFNPRPKIQLAAALPLGYSSTCEVLDIWLAGEAPASLGKLHDRIQAKVPPGLELRHVEQVPLKGPALQTLTREATYRIEMADGVDLEAVGNAVSDLLAASSIIRQRRGKDYDLRPLILNLGFDESGPPANLLVRLALGDAGTGRPDEVLDALGLDIVSVKVERTAIGFDDPQLA